MASAQHWPVPLTTVGPSTGGTALFRHAGKLHVTCVLKSTFAFVSGAPMNPVSPEEIVRVEAHHRDNPTRSVRATSDMVPHLPAVDVVLTGHAFAPEGTTVTRQNVRLAVFHGHALLDKTLHVYGDRSGGTIEPFDRIPLVYERALGGIGFRPNPYGTGKQPGSAPPNIVYPTDGSVVAGFGPLSRGLAARKSKLGSLPLSALDKPIPELPDDFDWRYFHAAPQDQQIPALVGNEWIVLEGMHPRQPRISSRLPTARALVTLFGLDPREPDAPRVQPMRLDILRIDADVLRCSLVFRAVVRLDDERALETLRIAGAVETESHSYAHLLTPPPMPQKSRPAALSVDDLAVTLARPEGRANDPATLVLEDTPSPGESPLMGTHALEGDAALALRDKPVIPFLEGAAPAPVAPRMPIPGAPWSGVPVEAPPLPEDEAPTRAMTFDRDITKDDFDPPSAPPPPPPPRESRPSAPPAAAPPPPPPPSPKAAPEDGPAKRGPWAEAPAAPEIAVPKPPPPRIPPRQSANRALYGGFGSSKKKG